MRMEERWRERNDGVVGGEKEQKEKDTEDKLVGGGEMFAQDGDTKGSSRRG